MGGMLSEPIEAIHVQRRRSEAFAVGVAEMHGWRAGHEDAHEVTCGPTSGNFWVLDGHCGAACAQLGAPLLAERLGGDYSAGLPSDDVVAREFAAVDEELRSTFERDPIKDSGSTVVGCLAARQPDGRYALKLANCGDSRGLVLQPAAATAETAERVAVRYPTHLLRLPAGSKPGAAPVQPEPWPLVVESIDHKPDHPTELLRIVARGGSVAKVPGEETGPFRLDGNLAVSRGLGDFEYKQRGMSANRRVPDAEQKVSNVPDIYEMEGLQEGTVVVLACDGVWDVLSAQDVAAIVRDKLREDPKADLGHLAADVVLRSFRANSQDNITCMIVVLSGAASSEMGEDEMFNYEKAFDLERLDSSVRGHYQDFFRQRGFAGEPTPCESCSRWYKTMLQCPCEQVRYCGKACQKRHWKTHKASCTCVAKSDDHGAAKCGEIAGNPPASSEEQAGSPPAMSDEKVDRPPAKTDLFASLGGKKAETEVSPPATGDAEVGSPLAKSDKQAECSPAKDEEKVKSPPAKSDEEAGSPSSKKQRYQ